MKRLILAVLISYCLCMQCAETCECCLRGRCQPSSDCVAWIPALVVTSFMLAVIFLIFTLMIILFLIRYTRTKSRLMKQQKQID